MRSDDKAAAAATAESEAEWPSLAQLMSGRCSRRPPPARDRIWRGPGVGGCELGKSIDSSQFRASVPMPTRPSVRCTRRPPRSLDLVAAEGSQQARSQTDDALESSWYQANVDRAGALSPMMDGSNSRLQARSSCTTAAVLCLPAAMPTHLMPSASILAHASMHS